MQLAVLAARIRAREGESGWLAPFVLASGAFAYSVFACSLVAFQALPFLTATQDAQAMRAMSVLGSVWFALDGLAAVPLVVAVAWATLATQALPRWFARPSFVMVPVALLMSLGGLVDQPAWLAGGGPATVGHYSLTEYSGVAYNGLCVSESKRDRVDAIMVRLKAATPAASADEAFKLVNAVVDAVENEMTDIPYDPAAAEQTVTDGRMYGPHPKFAADYRGRSDLTRYAHTAHDTFIQANGAILIRVRRPPTVLVSKPGADGKEIVL